MGWSREPPRNVGIDGDARTEIMLRLETISGNARSFSVVPTETIRPGSQLALEADAVDYLVQLPDMRARFSITEAAPLPATLGTLQVTTQQGRLRVAARGGSCSAEIDAAYADLSIPSTQLTAARRRCR